jgi:exocyst complex component 4
MVLLTMRTDLRLRAFYHFDKMVQQGLYDLTEMTQDPDTFIVTLNSELAQMDELLAGPLAPEDRK